MSKSKKKAAPKKEVTKKAVDKKVEPKKQTIKVEVKKPVEKKAMPTFIEIPYVPRKIDRLPKDLSKLKK
jgi:hypothetical protein